MDNQSPTPKESVNLNGISVPNVSVHMVRQTLDAIEGLEGSDLGLSLSKIGGQLPQGYQIRPYRTGDEQPWVELIRGAERFFVVDDELFNREFGSKLEELTDRMFFLEHLSADGTPALIGTATAWWKPAWLFAPQQDTQKTNRGEWGQVHWVAVHPDHQGKGLSKLLMAAVMNRLAHSHRRAMLGTSTARIWAIKVYLDLGFTPDPEELSVPAIRNAWVQACRALEHPALKAIV